MHNRSTTEMQVPRVRGASVKVLPDVGVAGRSCLTVKHKFTVQENLLFVGMCVCVHDNCERRPLRQGEPLGLE